MSRKKFNVFEKYFLTDFSKTFNWKLFKLINTSTSKTHHSSSSANSVSCVPCSRQTNLYIWQYCSYLCTKIQRIMLSSWLQHWKNLKGAVAEILVKMMYFFLFFFIGENLSLRSNWSHVKRLCTCEHGNPPKIGGMYVL